MRNIYLYHIFIFYVYIKFTDSLGFFYLSRSNSPFDTRTLPRGLTDSHKSRKSLDNDMVQLCYTVEERTSTYFPSLSPSHSTTLPSFSLRLALPLIIYRIRAEIFYFYTRIIICRYVYDFISGFLCVVHARITRYT